MDAASRFERFARALCRRQRIRRGLRHGLTALAITSVASLLVSALTWLTRFGFVWSARHVFALVVPAALLTGIVAVLARVRTARVLAEADRRLGGDDALVTAFELGGSSDPLCRLLLRRAADRLATTSARKALPLGPSRAGAVAPALLALALAAGMLAPDPQAAREPAATAADPVVGALSSGARRIASAMLAEHGPADAFTLDNAQRLLGIERDLRQGRLTLDAAREALGRLLGTSGPGVDTNPAAGGADPATTSARAAADERWRRELALMLEESVAAGGGDVASGSPHTPLAAQGTGTLDPGATAHGGAAGTGPGAGLGAAGPPSSARGDARAGMSSRPHAVWALPAPARAAAGATGPEGGVEDTVPVPSALGPLRAGGDLAPAGPYRPLTVPERAVVESYFAALRRVEREPEAPVEGHER